MSAEPITAVAGCAGCGTPLPASLNWKPRKWCSERCRKRSYCDPCIDCGTRTCFGGERARVDEPRCTPCSAANRTHWTTERLLSRIQEWAAIHGEPPAQPDWNPWQARHQMNDEARARRFEDAAGHWPSFRTVVDAFGRWNAAITAAGFTPRAPHGGGVNVLRRRRQRVAS